MSTFERLTTLAFGRRRYPELGEVEALLDHLPFPSLLYDQRERRILIANAQATALTA